MSLQLVIGKDADYYWLHPVGDEGAYSVQHVEVLPEHDITDEEITVPLYLIGAEEVKPATFIICEVLSG